MKYTKILEMKSTKTAWGIQQLQKQTQPCRKKNQWPGRQNMWNYPVREKRMKKSEESLWDTMKTNNIHIVGIPEEKETEGMLKAKNIYFL